MSKRLEVKVPFENVNDPSAQIISWTVPSGTWVKEGDLVAEVENSKTAFELYAPMAGIVEYAALLGQEVAAGEVLFVVIEGATSYNPPAPEQVEPVASTMLEPSARVDESASPAAPPSTTAAPVFSKKALNLIEESGIDLNVFAGMTMVGVSEVRQVLSATDMVTPPATEETANEAVAPVAAEDQTHAVEITGSSGSGKRETTEEPLERAKVLENRELGAANRDSLRSTIYYLCPASGFREACLRQSPRIDRFALILFEVVKLLTKHRQLNAYYQDQGLVIYRHVHVGFAVDMDRGLKVLVIRNAESLTFVEISSKVEELLVKYTTNTLATEDVTGSTFTVTDLSQEGVFAFEPLLNNRQAAILAIGAEQDGLHGFMLTCTFDHRLTAGKAVAEFLRDLSLRLVGHAESIQHRPSVDLKPSCARCFASIDELRRKQAFLMASAEPAGYICSLCLDGY